MNCDVNVSLTFISVERSCLSGVYLAGYCASGNYLNDSCSSGQFLSNCASGLWESTCTVCQPCVVRKKPVRKQLCYIVVCQ